MMCYSSYTENTAAHHQIAKAQLNFEESIETLISSFFFAFFFLAPVTTYFKYIIRNKWGNIDASPYTATLET